jgi:hypothetical protein
MPASYREIDYRVRPGKYAERLMMVDAFRRLRFGSVESYQYVGLGSVYFSDFALVHRTLGITKMVSIERNEHDKPRFLDNIPFACVEMLWGDTAAELQNVDLSLRSIVWLDFDGRLSRPILGDVADVARRIASGSVLAVTVQSRFERVDDENGDRSVEALIESVGSERVPHDLRTRDLQGKGTSGVFQKIILDEIDRALADRNAVIPPRQRMLSRQIFYFQYEDGVQMTTVGVVFHDAGQSGLFDLCGFEELDFVRSERDAFKIAIPKLTPNEVKKLEAQMPLNGEVPLARGSIPERDAAQYARLYRYFPNLAFVEP